MSEQEPIERSENKELDWKRIALDLLTYVHPSYIPEFLINEFEKMYGIKPDDIYIGHDLSTIQRELTPEKSRRIEDYFESHPQPKAGDYLNSLLSEELARKLTQPWSSLEESDPQGSNSN